MNSKKHCVVLDVGTTGVKSLVFDNKFNVVARSYRKLSKFIPKRGWVEQNPKEILTASKSTLKEAVRKSGVRPQSIVGLGITNQRETTIIWDKRTGEPVYPAIVWQDVRTRSYCEKKKRWEGFINKTTGLSIDPYFSATKIRWILKNVGGAKKLVQLKALNFGTVDTWVLWNLCEGNPHLTDYTNASRTLLFNIKKLKWDDKLLKIFYVPREILPKVKPSRSRFGKLNKNILGFSLPVLAMCGDQQASLYAISTRPGTTKVTYGTGTFVVQAMGRKFTKRKDLFTTLIPHARQPYYASEAKIDCCGAEVEKALHKKDKLQRVILRLAKKVDSVLKKLPQTPKELIIDGGVARDNYLLGAQSQISKIPVRRQKIHDGTSLGVAKLIFR